MAFNAGSIVGELRLNVSSIQQDVEKSKSAVSLGTIAIGNFLGNLASRVTASVVGMLRSATSQVLGFLGESSAAARDYASALLGLENVGNKLEISQEDLKAAVEGLTEDGLLTAGEAAQGLKNLLASGFGLPEAVQIMNTFKDASAFGRQASLSFGEAVVSATEGVKNQNSILVDNAGITKNLSVILKERGFQLQDLSDQEKGAAARQALLNGLQKEGELFAGDAAKASATLAGQQAKLGTQTTLLKVAVGEGLNPVLAALLEGITPNVEKMTAWVQAHKPEITGLLAQAGLFLVDVLRRLLPFVATIVDRFEIWGINTKLVINTISSLVLEVVQFVAKVGPIIGAIFPEVGDALAGVERDAGLAIQGLDSEFAELTARKLELQAKVKADTVAAQKVITDATAETVKKLEDQVAAARAFREEAKSLPAGIGAGGSVYFQQYNITGPFTGRDQLPDFLSTLDNRGDSNQGGGRGDGETPPPF